MKILGTKPELADIKDSHEMQKTIQTLEMTLGEIRHIIGRQRTILKNADKKLQEFQDTMYAMLIEEEYPLKKTSPEQADDDDLAAEEKDTR